MKKKIQKFDLSLSMLSDKYNLPIKPQEEEAKLEVIR